MGHMATPILVLQRWRCHCYTVLLRLLPFVLGIDSICSALVDEGASVLPKRDPVAGAVLSEGTQ